MTLDDFIIVTCLALFILCGIGYRHTSKHVYLRISRERRVFVHVQNLP